MKSSTLYRWLEWTFQPQTCTEVFPVIGLQEDNTEEITRVYTATFASPEVFEQLERLDANTCMLFTHQHGGSTTADPAEMARFSEGAAHLTVYLSHSA